MKHIDEAVEILAKSITEWWDVSSEDFKNACRGTAKDALGEILPSLMSAAWAEGYAEGDSDRNCMRNGWITEAERTPNPYSQQ